MQVLDFQYKQSNYWPKTFLNFFTSDNHYHLQFSILTSFLCIIDHPLLCAFRYWLTELKITHFGEQLSSKAVVCSPLKVLRKDIAIVSSLIKSPILACSRNYGWCWTKESVHWTEKQKCGNSHQDQSCWQPGSYSCVMCFE